ncbi:phosphonate metabolism protein/1,5-bisphosphokinase (PRPP-forming) PhnN [Shimia abyssi]|uniref:ribose 1,5-bisphosphate phosphokinase n=1 Tax=Shimia abyssi TaxID=1662395 RepID=A0A2P8F736_9RHOB|nr:phosphonate metabolism protein/1,5-bisphosphokinase (PRPP-forming) PhnN [Shimia abyssi]PSL17526.1 ribose 1,5-bisphosphokinase [Shimia abyssi]
MTVRVIGVVGPSGAGKDTVMRALAAARPEMVLVKRVITRAPDEGGEDYTAVGSEAFERMVAEGAFALSWGAHGLRYGVPRGSVIGRPKGEMALVNLSRSVLDDAREQLDGFRVLSLTARPETLAVRLVKRGRESHSEITSRLARADHNRPVGADVMDVSNERSVQETVSAVLSALYPVRAKR